MGAVSPVPVWNFRVAGIVFVGTGQAAPIFPFTKSSNIYIRMMALKLATFRGPSANRFGGGHRYIEAG